MFLTLPLMIAVQEICGRIGIVTGKGLAAVIKENYAKPVLYTIVFLLLLVNTINLGVDIGAMAAVSQLFIKAPFILFAAIFFVIILVAEIFVPYHRYAKILKWLTFSLLAYFITGFIVGGDWREILKASFIPHFEFNYNFVFMFLGVIGTTISPYLFFWQASQEVEEEQDYYVRTNRMPKVTPQYISNMRLDTFIGMIFSNLTPCFIILVAYELLYKNCL